MSSEKQGKICYMEIPARDIAVSSHFYTSIFGWTTRRRSNGSTAFDDATGYVSGSWILGRPPSTAVGILTYILVEDAEATVKKILEEGGTIVQSIGGDAPEITARFLDPAGNILGIYQSPSKKT
ncbi:VOC family protein [Terriglobus saanensis]|uniref:Glyoxalase/bleomycin resistance protein/dioxygenase n=1 Tax=Terriglobus saanensis (strain ATCC BAA-1853 / DSM 23119 / SP1PR4) TaxID=401053 RepID=E8V8C9_TERSS|nr:VOC family protein [Terriglobus saanensis]ADV81832.1 Glyoxalase/bleomycin resistance protein/dioxygenase [Terriglobus saanensis SP1PR4]